MMQLYAILLLLLLLPTGHAGAEAHQDADADDERSVVSWIKSRGGYVNPHQVISREDPYDPTSLRGVFAIGDIEEGELLLDLPTETIIFAAGGDDHPTDERRTDDDGSSGGDMCGLVQTLKRELKLGDSSTFAPYLKLLNRENVSLPDTFTQAGQELLRKVVGPHLEPQKIGGHVRWWSEQCGGDPHNDELGLTALLVVVTRSCPVCEEYLMAPYYDMYNHRNGFRENTRVVEAAADAEGKEGEGRSFRVYASRRIEAGEEIYVSYGSGVANILLQYGFVEQLPHYWSFDIPKKGGMRGGRTKTKLEYKIEFVLEDDDGLLDFWWRDDIMPTPSDVDYLKTHEQSRLDGIEGEILCADSADDSGGASCHHDDIPPQEREVITQYYRVLKLAIDTAVAVAEERMEL